MACLRAGSVSYFLLKKGEWVCSHDRFPMRKKTAHKEPIVVDEENQLVFQSEEEVLSHFSQPIKKLEREFLRLRSVEDFTDTEAMDLEKQLAELLEKPDEIWEDRDTVSSTVLYNFIGSFKGADQSLFHYVAVVYLSQEVPTFVFLHFPTKYEKMCENYRRGQQIYGPSLEGFQGSIEGDALSEKNPLAVGLYKAMLQLRSSRDIEESSFLSYSEMREEAIEEADEIWRHTGLSGQTLVSFIKDFSRPHSSGETLYYIAVTLEEDPHSHALLFSFPTNDDSLVDRYRYGENLHAGEVVRESSH